MDYLDPRVSVVFLGRWDPEDLQAPVVLQGALDHKVQSVRRVHKVFLAPRGLPDRLGQWDQLEIQEISDHLAQLVTPENKDQEVRWENVARKAMVVWLVLPAFRETPGLMVFQVNQVIKAKQVNLVEWGFVDQLGLQVWRARTENRVHQVILGSKDKMDHTGFKEVWDRKDRQANPVMTGNPDQWDHQDLPDHLVHLVLRVQEETRD